MTKPTAPSTSSPAMASTTLRQTFDRMDQNKNGSLSRPEVKTAMEKSGIGDGWFGGMKVDGATDALVDGLDKNRDQKVSFREYANGGHQLAPAGMALDPATLKDPAKLKAAVDALYADADDNGDAKLSKAELTAHQSAQAQAAGQSHADTRGEIAATLALQNLDTNRDGKLHKEELHGFLRDVAREQAAATAPRPAS